MIKELLFWSAVKQPCFKIMVFLIPLLLIHPHGYAQQNISLKNMDEISGIDLENDWSYRNFRANDNFLVWYEEYKMIVYIYDLKTEDLGSIQLHEGRGPNEVLRLTDLYISHDNIIFIIDPENAKIVRYNTSGEVQGEIVPSPEMMLFRFARNSDHEVLMEPVNPESILWVSHANEFDFSKISLDNPVSEEFPTPFHRDGWVVVDENHLILMPRLYTSLYVFDLIEKKQLSKFEFDESGMSDLETVVDEDGNKFTLPPEKSDVVNFDISPVPKVNNRVFLVSKGIGQKREYSANVIYEFDYINKLLVKKHTLSMDIDAIFSNSESVFVFSEEENSVYEIDVAIN